MAVPAELLRFPGRARVAHGLLLHPIECCSIDCRFSGYPGPLERRCLKLPPKANEWSPAPPSEVSFPMMLATSSQFPHVLAQRGDPLICLPNTASLSFDVLSCKADSVTVCHCWSSPSQTILIESRPPQCRSLPDAQSWTPQTC